MTLLCSGLWAHPRSCFSIKREDSGDEYLVPMILSFFLPKPVPGVRNGGEGQREKIYAGKVPPLPPKLLFFFCSHLFELSPRSEHLEQAISPLGKEGREP